MHYKTIETHRDIILEPQKSATACVIWLHGLGADGHDFVPMIPELRLPESMQVRFIFPHADARPITINNGYVMRAWYDITGVSLAHREDTTGIRESEQRIRGYIDEQIVGGLEPAQIIIAGFSQGGAIALQTALRFPKRLAGVLALSTYLPLRDSLAAEAAAENRDVGILMCHGLYDGIVPLALGELSRDALRQLGYSVDWKTYPMEHNVCEQEIDDIRHWLIERLLTAQS